jgi:hypothetical protein
LAIKDARIAQLLSICETSPADPVETQLGRICETLRRSLENLLQWPEPNAPATGLGLLAGFDAALAIGDHLCRRVDGASWRVMRTGDPIFMSKNLAVVRRPDSWEVFEPFWEGRTSLTLIMRERGKQPSNVLNWKFNFWTKALKVRAATRALQRLDEVD